MPTLLDATCWLELNLAQNFHPTSIHHATLLGQQCFTMLAFFVQAFITTYGEVKRAALNYHNITIDLSNNHAIKGETSNITMEMLVVIFCSAS